ncbi:MAG: alkaline phosphatase family protein [Sulfolobaceae archaeon]
MKLLLTVIDGIAYNMFERFRYRLKTLGELAESGIYSKLESVIPSLTPIALASLYTGNLPKNNGVTHPKIFVKGNKISSPISAFSSKALISEPIWSILARKGYKVIVLSAPQSLPDKWNIKNLLLLDPYKARNKICSKPFVLKAGENMILEKKWTVNFNNNKAEIEYPSINGIDKIELDLGQWSRPVEFIGNCKNREYRAVSILYNKGNSIYVSPPSFLNDEWYNNKSVGNEVWEKVSKKYGMMLDGDYYSLSKGIINFNEYFETLKISYNFFLNYSLYMLQNYDWDFAITYLPIVDNIQHLLYGVNDSRALDYIFKAYEYADEFVRLHLNLCDTIVIVSDHGIEKIRKRVYVNKILEKINVLKIKNNEIYWKQTKAYYAGGGIIRINLKGREDRGIVSQEEYSKLVRYIVKNLENYKDPENGKNIFISIIANEIPAGDREGDIIVGVEDGYSLSSSIDTENEIEKVEHYITITADHGYYKKDDLYGIVIFYGKGIIKKRINNARIIDIAPTILKLMNVENIKMDGNILL